MLPWHRVWEIVVTASIVYLAIEVPLHLVLDEQPSRTAYWLSTVVLIGDVFAQAHPSMRRLSRRIGARTPHAPALSVAWFAVDAVSALPFRVVPGLAPLELLRFVKLARILQLMGRWRHHTVQFASLLLLAFFVFWLMFVAHWLACGWLALGGIEQQSDPMTRYVRALYWCITTLATVGYGDIVPRTNAQTVYSMLVIVVGVAGYGWVIGNVANLLANLDRARQHHTENLERLAAFLRYRNIPIGLQRRLRDYYAYLWENRLGYDEQSVMADLPQGLRGEVALHLRRDFIQRTPLFRSANPELVRELAMELIPVVFTPGEYVFRAGEHGSNMYFIGRGRVEVVAADGATVLATLKDGEFFGELALLFSQARNASVRAAEYSDLYSLDKQTFDRAIARHPEFAAHIKEEARRRSAE